MKIIIPNWLSKQILLLFLLPLSPASPLHSHVLPFPENERLEYQLRWHFIRLGTAILIRNPDTTFETKPCLHFTMTARTYGIADKIFKVRDRIDSYTDPDLHNTLHYKQRQNHPQSHSYA